MTPVHGLMVTYRLYKCDVCQTEYKVQTNHTDVCFPPCPHCSWRSGYDSTGKHYRADTGKMRPHYYVGPEVTPEEINPKAPCNNMIDRTNAQI